MGSSVTCNILDPSEVISGLQIKTNFLIMTFCDHSVVVFLDTPVTF